ncbi:MAG: hypothetical protein MJ171_06885 [Clostridia bacterium]|nr:hypothetical protein [Clostridia bacterium]
MKKIVVLLLIFVLSLSIFACTEKEEPAPVPDAEKIKVNSTVEGNVHIVTVSGIPEKADDLMEFDFTDEYQAAAAVMMALAVFEENPDLSIALLDTVMGPESPSKFDEDFLKNQFAQYPYVIRSYFDGATVDNDYTVSGDYVLRITENIYSRQENGYVKLWFKSSGADSERSFTLRQKESTKEWFLFSDTYKGMTAGIRLPKSLDKWA